MDDGNSLLPRSVNPILFLQCLNSLHPNIVFTLEPAKQIIVNGQTAQSLDFLDITITLHNNGKIETDIYYKPTNSHQYLDYNSFHPKHIKDNVPFGLAKRIICFVTNSETMEFRLLQLKSWLLKCNYSEKLIEKCIHNSRLQGPAPKPVSKNDIIPFVTTFASNFETKGLTNNIRTLISNKKNGKITGRFIQCHDRCSLQTTKQSWKAVNESQVL